MKQTYYKFDDEEPRVGVTTCAFRSLKALEDFLNIVGVPEGNEQSVYELSGKVVSDDGYNDGLEICVSSYSRLYTPKK